MVGLLRLSVTLSYLRGMSALFEGCGFHSAAAQCEVPRQHFCYENKLVSICVWWRVLICDRQHRVHSKIHSLAIYRGCEENTTIRYIRIENVEIQKMFTIFRD